MRSYLHRMAANALSRERSIHPVLGSLWASQRSADSFEASGETLVPGARPQRAQDAEQSQTPIQPRSLVQSARMESMDVEREQRSAEHSSEFMPQTRAEVAMPIHPSSETAQVHAMSALPRVASQSEGDSGLRAVGSEFQQRNFKPLVPESSERAQASQNVAVPAVAAPRIDSFRRQALAQSSRGPDSIEIHIGRIEVLAAQPQPAQRPPVQPARKSLDLGEYLRRGGGTR
ncbi:hypothetical protein [Terracidiphilus gabretensis]|jgi:hypothetical protein|uniref:hypothetical protein n=1 Tax=Terracidiphilus gabretensis TaxID=1577687 RepID=UPI00071BC9BA|nr:hypothetical protein [Terracidiphilus gabretensis]